jgi:hypothetical protein
MMAEATRPEDLSALADELLSEGLPGPEIMSSKCHGGGGATTGSAPGCSDISEASNIAS